jgi:hypothetical protein
MTPFHAFQGVFQSPALQAAAWGVAASFVLCVLLVITKRMGVMQRLLATMASLLKSPK